MSQDIRWHAVCMPKSSLGWRLSLTRRNRWPGSDARASGRNGPRDLGRAVMESIIVTTGTRLSGVAAGAGRRPLNACCTSLVLATVACWTSAANSAINTWTINASLSTAANWSEGSAPNSSSSLGSYQDGLFASVSTEATSSSNNLYFQSVNVTNGSTYRVLAGSTSAFNFRVGQTGTGAPGEGNAFTNGVSGSAQDLVYLANNSSLTLSGTTSSSPSVTSNFSLRSYGNL